MSKDIAILGGGLNGMVCAYFLSRLGHRVTIYEQSNQLGGLAAGFPLNGTSLEKAYHHIFTTDSHIIDLVKELGIEDSLLWHKGSIGLFYDKVLYPFMSPRDLLLFKPLPILDRIRLGLVVLYLQKTRNWKKYVNVTASDWMKSCSGKRGFQVIWEPLLRGKFHEQYDKVSMAWLWARIHTRANSRTKDITQETLGYFKGGFQVIVTALSDMLHRQGVEVNLSSPVQSIQYDHQSKKILVAQANVQRRYDRVICTIPSSVFSRLIARNDSVTEDYKRSLESISYLHAVCVIFTSKQKLTDYYWNNVNDLNSPFLAFICHTNLVDRSLYKDEEVYYLGTYLPDGHRYLDMPEDSLIDEWFYYLNSIFPEFDIEGVTARHIFRLRHAQHVVDKNYLKKMPSYQTPIPGVFLANFSQIYPEDRGTNFAVKQAKEVSALVINSLA